MKTRWLDRRIACPGPFLALCLSDDEWKAVSKKLGVSASVPWLATDRADATTHIFDAPDGRGLCCVVCLQVNAGRAAVEIAGLIVHESVHVWQQYAESIGEHRPGVEQEAYAVQSIAQELMAEYARRLEC
jgi:hypothetical protein